MNRINLQLRLDREGFRRDAYTLDGSTPLLLEGYVLRTMNGLWRIEYYELGATRTLGTFPDEHQACSRLYEMLGEDPTTRVS